VSTLFVCPHFGLGKVVPTQTRVLVNTLPVATAADQYPVTGCAFTVPGPKPQPCVLIQWSAPATRVKINGVPAMLGTSGGVGVSADQIKQGPALVLLLQPRVTAT
jgi:uncharacterized Zn-binding protein involved in type VI secretion